MIDEKAKAFIISGTVLAALLLMHNLPTLSFGDTTLRDVNILSDVLPEAVDSSDILRRPDAVLAQNADTLKYEEYRPKGVTMIDDYSNDKDGGMNHFYKMLSETKTLNRPVRIAYYGDSFIEGDILTADIREILQQKFGGNGIGWVDCQNGTNNFRPTLTLKSSGFDGHVVTKKPFDHTLQGVNQKYFIASPGATLSYTGTSFRKGPSHWQKAKLFFKSDGNVGLSARINGGESVTKSAGAASGVQCVEFSGNMNKIAFTVTDCPPRTVFYGAALESDRGIIVDNLGVRGIPGYSLADIPVNTLKGFANYRPYDLIIIHYGLNAVAGKTPKGFPERYIKRMKKVIGKLRKAYPEASILVMSVSDRDQRSADGIKTISSVRDLSITQQNLANECKVAYFNLFDAMGGENSMKTMVDKGLANKDYTHINFEGGKFIADKICKSLLAGLENYKRKKEAGIIN